MLKIIKIIIEKLLGTTARGEERMADMYWKNRLLAIALSFLIFGIGCVFVERFRTDIFKMVLCTLCDVLGVIGFLCWRNQSIHVISNEKFTYTTMFGKKYTYSFSDIEGVKRSRDSMTLFVSGRRIYFESLTVLSERLVTLINGALEEKVI